MQFTSTKKVEAFRLPSLADHDTEPFLAWADSVFMDFESSKDGCIIITRVENEVYDIEVEPGEWIVLDGDDIVVMYDYEFEEKFSPIDESNYNGWLEPVFPSTEPTVRFKDDNPAHSYLINLVGGVADNGTPEYTSEVLKIDFIQRLDDGSFSSGIQNEQLAIMLIDRMKRLNSRFPCPENYIMIRSLENFLKASVIRISGRMKRGVQGKLKE